MRYSNRIARAGLRWLTLLLFFSFWTAALQAMPAKRVVRTITQPDGTTLSIVLQGDEHFHFLTTIDGIMIQEASDGFMKYTIPTSQGVFAAGKYMAHDPGKREEVEQAYIEDIDKTEMNSVIFKMRNRQGVSQWHSPEKPKFPNSGTVRGLILLVQFNDVKFAEGNTPQEFKEMMNVKDYSKNQATGSARDYFIDQSLGVFTPEFDIVGPITLKEDMSYYGRNSMYGPDKNAGEMIANACCIADTTLSVDFSQYDFDKDGKVDLVYVIYAGYSEAQGASPDCIWPHAWNLEAAGFQSYKLDGKQIFSYACSSELSGNTGTTMDGIGTFCHEFSHCLGLPDVYDVRYSGMIGMEAWSLMDYGGYNNESRTPAGYSAFERYSVGWLTPIELKEPQRNISLSPLSTDNQAYMIVSDKNPNEYYTLENRQNIGWDKYLPGHGMMIVHVDYDSYLWNSNIINTATSGHAHLQIVPADNEFTDFSGDAFPGTTKNTAFADETQPAAFLYSGSFMGKPISKIAEKDGIITFDFMHYVGAPIAKEATDIKSDQFIANWSDVKAASKYTLKVAASMTGKTSVKEDFTKFTEGSQTKPDTQDIATELDTYTSTPRWKGEMVYQAGGYCQLGSATAIGKLTTPLLDFSGEKEFTVCCNVKGSKSQYNGFEFGLLNVNGKVLINKTVIMVNTEKKVYWTFSTDEQTGSVYIMTRVPALFKEITIYNGNVKEQLENGEVLTEPEIYSKEIEDITTNSFVVTGLKDNKKYIYNVYAYSDEEVSPISNKILLQTTIASGIESATTSQRDIQTEKGLLRFVTEVTEPIRIYTTDGMTIYSDISNEGINQINLSGGLYILSIGTERFKVHVP